MQKQFVEYYSPGTFVAESTRREVNSFYIEEAMKMADEVKERHGATPFGFCFITMSRSDDDLDSKRSFTSAMHHLGGTKLTLEDIKARNDPDDRILISNMECNGYAAVIENTNSWKSVQPFGNDDILLDYTPKAAQK